MLIYKAGVSFLFPSSSTGSCLGLLLLPQETLFRSSHHHFFYDLLNLWILNTFRSCGRFFWGNGVGNT